MKATITSSAVRALVVLCLLLLAAPLFADELAASLATEDPARLASAVAQIERTPAADADTLYAAGRACEDKLLDPARALVLYDRLLRDHPDASVALGAEQHATRLRAQLAGGHARETAAFAQLVADADRLAPAEVIRRADALAAAPGTGVARWPGAAEATLWLAEYLRRAGLATATPARFAEADARYARVLAEFPGTREARLAASGRAGAAIDARAWDRAPALIAALPAATPEDLAIRADLEAALRRGELRAHLYVAAEVVLVLACVLLLASLAEAALRGGWRRPALRPPFEIWFLGPVALVLALVSFTTHQAIAPAVVRIAITGIALAWLSGATLDLLRVRGRAWKPRAVAQTALCIATVLAVAYLALTGSGLLDMIGETVRFGPDV